MTTAAEVIALAAADDGYAEDPPGSNHTKFGKWYGLDGSPWCAMAVSKWFFDGDMPLAASTSKGFAYTPAGADWFRRQGRWSDTPHVGDVVFFYWVAQRRIAHTGIVARVHPDGSFETWEGNTDVAGGRTGGRVLLQRRSLATVNVDRGGGFGRPAYLEPPPRPVAQTYPEDAMVRHDLRSPLDDQGNGYIDVAIPAASIVSIVPNGDDPSGPAGDVGYKPIPRFSRLDWAGGSRIVVLGGPPRGAVDFAVWTAA